MFTAVLLYFECIYLYYEVLRVNIRSIPVYIVYIFGTKLCGVYKLKLSAVCIVPTVLFFIITFDGNMEKE